MSGENRHCLHRLQTVDSARNVGAVDERAAVDQMKHLIHFEDDVEDCAGVGDGHLYLCSTDV